MPLIYFDYPHNTPRTLIVETGANQISWSYNLNTQTYPTYAGEVVQVLSTNIDILTIQGEVPSYQKMEEIYRWFLEYMSHATQGFRGVADDPTSYSSAAAYNEDYVNMAYPHRGWNMQIQPISLPGLKYGRDIVVPTWQMQAHVVEPDPEQAKLTLDAATVPELNYFRDKITADIGYRQANPFSDPLGVLTKEEKKLWPDAPNRVEGDVSNDLKGIAKRLANMLQEYIDSNFTSVIDTFTNGASGPATPQNAMTEQTKPGSRKG